MQKLLVGIAGLLVAGAVSANSVNVQNASDWAFVQLFVSPVNENAWGADQLGSHVVASGESFTLSGVPCDTYDVKLVDEDGDQCVVGGVDICGGSDTWVVDNEDLLTCQVLTEANADE